MHALASSYGNRHTHSPRHYRTPARKTLRHRTDNNTLHRGYI